MAPDDRELLHYQGLVLTPQKPKFLKIVGWTAYVAFGLFSTFCVALGAGFWPMFAWICLILVAPKLIRNL